MTKDKTLKIVTIFDYSMSFILTVFFIYLYTIFFLEKAYFEGVAIIFIIFIIILGSIAIYINNYLNINLLIKPKYHRNIKSKKITFYVLLIAIIVLALNVVFLLTQV
jgi:hypothetical protein